ADRAAVLVPDADRLITLLEHPRLIKQKDAIFFTQGLGKQGLMAVEEWSERPGTLADEVLQGADRHPQGQCHWLNRLAGNVREQAAQVLVGAAGLFGTGKSGGAGGGI